MHSVNSPIKTLSGKVLVLDADQVSALAIVRALGKKNLCVDVASANLQPISGYSGHARRTLSYPDPLTDETSFVDWTKQRIETDTYDLIIPVTERTLVPLLKHRKALDDRSIAMAPSESLEQVLDKERTIALAASLDIPVPKSATVNERSELSSAASCVKYPVVIKPSRSVGAGSEGRVQLSVSYASNETELVAQALPAMRYGPVILQEYFRGDGVGIELIADRGKIRFAFQHRRLHEVPLTGGGSSLRVSEAITPPLLAASEKLIAALNWHGVAMVEFKYAPQTGEFRLMEINGRFWGSLPLAIAAGADFPRMLYELMCEGRIVARPAARQGVVCRQLARDVDWLEHVLRRNAPASLVTIPSWKDVLRDSALVFSPRHHFDVQSLRDPKPGLVDLGRIVATLLHRATDLPRTGWRLNKQLTRAHRKASGECLNRVRSVLFLCYGNINRSALAHAYTAARPATNLKLMSAGFHTQAGRPADPVMVETAAKQGIDLSTWQSNCLDNAMVASADLILAMELTHIDRLLTRFPEAASKTFLLGAACAASRDEVEIIDPYGLSPDTYQAVCRQVTRSVDAWFGQVQLGTKH